MLEYDKPITNVTLAVMGFRPYICYPKQCRKHYRKEITVNSFRKSLYVGALLMAPFLLSASVASANSKPANNQQNVQVQRLGASQHESEQQIANQQPQAVKNDNSPIERGDSKYWINRVNLAAYKRQNYRYPHISWNGRDMGGYYAGHGMWTKTGVVYRGANLHKISKYGTQHLKDLGINEVIDLRSYHHQGGADPNEDHPNQPNPLGVKYVEAVVNTRADKQKIAPFKRACGGEIYKYATSFLRWKHARQAYHQVFMELLNHKSGAIYFHCINGDDRTGIMAALYLSALGVSKWHIYNDFMITDYYDHKMSYRNKAAEMNRFFWGIRTWYGTMDNYLTSSNGLGLTHKQIKQLRSKYLVNYKG